MYRVMIVDDEPLILEGLKNILEWEKLGFEIVCSCENGQMAYEKFKENPVDLIITDINMPKMTGLEMIKKLRQEGADVKCIILSGYDDFSFAQTAIKYGVEEYILKPIDEEALELALGKIDRSFKERMEHQHLILSKNEKLWELLRGTAELEDLNEIKRIMKITLDASHYTVTHLTYALEGEDHFITDIQMLLDGTIYKQYELVKVFDGQIILLHSWEANVDKAAIRKYFEGILKEINQQFKLEVFIAIGDWVDSIEEIHQSYEVANNLKKYILVEGVNKCIESSMIQIKEESELNFAEIIDELHRLVLDKNMLAIKKYIQDSFSRKDLSPSETYDLAIKMIILVDKISEDFALSKYGQTGLSTAIVNLCQEKNLDGLESFIIREVMDLIDKMNSYNENYSPVVQQVIQTIHAHCEEELSLKTLAQKYNMNSSYLGQIFSKEVGMPFSEYLNRTKNMKAKELILTTNMKINDVAKAVGYLDTSYFYRKFKKYYGVSPSTLRELKNY